MQDFLQDLGVTAEGLACGHNLFDRSPRSLPVRMLAAHQVHRDVGVDEDHSSGSPLR